MRMLVAALFASSTAAAQDIERFDTIEKAVASTTKSKKDIIVDFTGSDWCGWCIKLNKEVFDQADWKKAASAKYVFVELDYPQKKKLADEQKTYNDRTQKLYGIQGFPTIVVLDAAGFAYARTGYQEGGPDAYLKHLEEFAVRKDEIAELRKKSQDKMGDGTKALEELMTKLDEWEVAFAYLDVKEQLVEAGGDKAKKYAKDLALTYDERGEKEKHKKYLEILRKLDKGAAESVEMTIKLRTDISPLIEKSDWKGALEKLKPLLESKGEAGQLAHYYAALCEFRLKNRDAAIKLLEKALELAPQSEMADQIKSAIDELKQ